MKRIVFALRNINEVWLVDYGNHRLGHIVSFLPLLNLFILKIGNIYIYHNGILRDVSEWAY